jgi:hypothetical protein
MTLSMTKSREPVAATRDASFAESEAEKKTNRVSNKCDFIFRPESLNDSSGVAVVETIVEE